MKRALLIFLGLYLLLVAAAAGQSGPAPVTAPSNGQAQPVSYASVTQLNGLLAQVETISKNTQADLLKLRIEKWKADGNYKRQALGNVDSIQRNLQGALPEMIGQLRNAPEDLPATFKLYRNLDALYDVLGSVAEGAGAFGSKDDLQSLSNDLNEFEGSRRQLAERIESLSSSKEAELTRLRTQLKTLQTQVEAVPPKKIVVDDAEPPKKPATTKKKTTTKKPATDATKPAAGSTQSTPAQPQTKPQ
jgi:DNA repair exonuclease SbcCD ATPase subunit